MATGSVFLGKKFPRTWWGGKVGSGVSVWIWRAPSNQSDFSESVAFESPGTHPPSYDMFLVNLFSSSFYSVTLIIG